MPRLVKRYGNRKLYDTSESRYVTLDEIARWVKAGEEVKILENDTGEDLTAVTFAQIILEEERRKSGLLSLRVLREIIQHGEAALQDLAATVDRGMEAIRTAPERAGRACRSFTSRSAERLDRAPAQPRRDRPPLGRARHLASRVPAGDARIERTHARSRRASRGCAGAKTTRTIPVSRATAPRPADRSASRRPCADRSARQEDRDRALLRSTYSVVLPSTISMMREWPYAPMKSRS